MLKPSLARRLTSEFLGTLLLLAAIVGSGIMAERLAPNAPALALLANILAISAALLALIFTFGPISGAHFNPALTIADAVVHGLPWREVPGYLAAQLLGAFAGVVLAHLMFGLPLLTASVHIRAGSAQVLSEFIATFGLLAVIWGTARSRPAAIPFAVSTYIFAACWFTPSASFANPAVTLARAFSNTYTGIRPPDVPAFIVAQLAGALAATLLFRWLTPGPVPPILLAERPAPASNTV